MRAAGPRYARPLTHKALDGGGKPMTIERKEIEAAFAALYEHADKGDWNA